MANNVDPIGLAKAILWEEAKGKMRAVARASGQHQSNVDRSPKWEDVERSIETFILHFETRGYHE